MGIFSNNAPWHARLQLSLSALLLNPHWLRIIVVMPSKFCITIFFCLGSKWVEEEDQLSRPSVEPSPHHPPAAPARFCEHLDPGIIGLSLSREHDGYPIATLHLHRNRLGLRPTARPHRPSVHGVASGGSHRRDVSAVLVPIKSAQLCAGRAQVSASLCSLRLYEAEAGRAKS